MNLKEFSFWNNNYIQYESNGDKNNNLSLDEIKPYLKDIIIDLQSSDIWEIELTIAINFISSEDTEEERVIHSMSDNRKFTSYNDVNEVVNKLFESLLSRYQDNLETSTRGSEFNFDSVQLMYYECHKVNFKRCGSYIDSPDWIKDKKATINPQNEDDKCFHYAATVALNYKETESHPERVSSIEPFIIKYKWEAINYLAKMYDWKKFEKNNPSIAVNVLYTKEKEILPVYISNHNSSREMQIVLLMIQHELKDGWHYLVVKKLPLLLHGITSKHKGDFCRLNCLHSFTTKNKIKSHETICKNKIIFRFSILIY